MITNLIVFVFIFETNKKKLDKEILQKLISKRIIQIREEKGFLNLNLVHYVIFEKSNMSRIESGRISPSLITLYKISLALNVNFHELFIFEINK